MVMQLKGLLILMETFRKLNILTKIGYVQIIKKQNAIYGKRNITKRDIVLKLHFMIPIEI